MCNRFSKNLRLGAGAPAIGIPFFWPSSAMPNTVMDEWADMVFLKFNGATFSASAYPKLALVIPSLTLVDARGEFPRIWDDGRGVDSGRTLLSAQSDAIRDIVGGTAVNNYNGWLANGEIKTTEGTGAIKINSVGARVYAASAPSGTISTNWFYWDFVASRVVPTASENRPRNVAFNFLIRAK